MIYRSEYGEIVFDQDGCTGVRLYESAGNEYVHLSIDPGGSIPEHSLPLAVSFCVLKGQGICHVSGSRFEVAPGEMLECPPNELRGWSNESAEPLEVLVIKRAAG